MSETPSLFDDAALAGIRRERAPRRKFVMHVCDAGGGCGDFEDGSHDVRFGCGRCGHETGWTRVRNVTEARRGLTCPVCAAAETKPAD